MPGAEAATVERRGQTLHFAGTLLRADVAALWRRALPLLPGVGGFDLGAVTRVDSAGVALLAELAARADGAIAVAGSPAGLDELRAAYRLTPALAFA